MLCVCVCVGGSAGRLVKSLTPTLDVTHKEDAHSAVATITINMSLKKKKKGLVHNCQLFSC